MRFSAEAIENKKIQLDAIDKYPELVKDVVAGHIDEDFTLQRLRRYWEPGGGATLYCIVTKVSRYFLKVKHASVFVESMLESETDYIRLPSLQNEANFLSILQSDDVPDLLFYEERNGFSFLAMEMLTPFAEGVDTLLVSELLAAWTDLESFVRSLYDRGIVHTDLHEGNLCFRKSRIVVCDFEEARCLAQHLPFTESLDYCGQNRYGEVGSFPSETNKGIPGLTSLLRLKEVFKSRIRTALLRYLVECKFDHTCSFNADVLQHEDSRIYQSVDCDGILITGQRPLLDGRKHILQYLLAKHWIESKEALHHIDLGSNLGTFCFVAATVPYVSASIGLEAFDRYIVAANALRFLYDAEKASFVRFVCGESKLKDLGMGGEIICTMLSVYHHVENREFFLSDLLSNRPVMLLAEFATQERYYPERGSLVAEIEYIRDYLGYKAANTVSVSSDYKRPLVLFSDGTLKKIDNIYFRMAGKKFFKWALSVLITARGAGRLNR
ncbi:MAG: hypothetical protein RQ760_16100 [Sedimentisphaerales bacterium]|nr:hypothetical protein [Sedimentisphaerales bacterium]